MREVLPPAAVFLNMAKIQNTGSKTGTGSVIMNKGISQVAGADKTWVNSNKLKTILPL